MKSDISIHIGKRIRHFRERKALTQKALSELLHVSESTVAKWEQGVVIAPIEMLLKLQDVLEISNLDELIPSHKSAIKGRWHTPGCSAGTWQHPKTYNVVKMENGNIVPYSSQCAKHADDLHILTKEQANAVLDAIERGDNIAITGTMASGKSTLHNELMGACANSKRCYTFIDEVTAKADVELVNKILSQPATSSIMFTRHLFYAADITKIFPLFTGVVIHTMCHKGVFSAELIGV